MLKDIIKRSRSYRRFKKVKIKKQFLKELVKLARFSPSSANLQPLKFMLSCDPGKNDLIFPALNWAGYLKKWKGPAESERPAGYIIILGDTRISKKFACDHGIAAQSILLGAAEKGFGGCMAGAIDRKLLRKNLNISARYEILLVVALGKPAEKVILEDVKKSGSIKYYRDKKDSHHVPKRKLEELIIE